MANEQERPLEKLLHAAAKKRRDEAGAPFELHPATRRLLQGEVVRQFAKAQSGTRPALPLLVRLWPRLAWAVAIFAVLGVAVWVLLPPPDKANQLALLARNAPAEQALPAGEPLPPLPAAPITVAPQPATAPQAGALGVAYSGTAQPASRKLEARTAAQAPQFAKDRLVADTDGAVQEKRPLAATPELADRRQAAKAEIAASSTAAASPPAGSADGVFQQRYGLAASPTVPARAPAAIPPAPVATMSASVPLAAVDKPAGLKFEESAASHRAYESLAAAASANRSTPSSAAMDSLGKSAVRARKEAKSGSVVQRFVQVAPSGGTRAAPADKAKAARPVLASFQVEQADHELWVTDEDGSVYAGDLQPVEANYGVRIVNAEAPRAALASRATVGGLERSGLAEADFGQPASQNYSFSVAGTNRTLQKWVMFTGNLIVTTNLAQLPPTATNLTITSRVDDAWGGSVQPGVRPLLSSRINGKVVIGNGKAAEINALPASP